MSNDHSTLDSNVWNFAHVLRDQGIGYGDYVEQITFLLFLKMDDERSDLLGEPSAIPAEPRQRVMASPGVIDDAWFDQLRARAEQRPDT